MKIARGFEETKLTVEKMTKGRISDKHQSRMTSVKYDHLQVMGTITGKFQESKSIENCERSCTDKNVSTDGLTDIRKNPLHMYYNNALRLRQGTHMRGDIHLPK